MRRAQARALLSALLAFFVLVPASPVSAADSVTEWTELADGYGGGLANWRTLAIMHQAVHDALNAALPTFERWAAPTKDEPSAAGALPGAATAAAAAQVLRMVHPSRQEHIERTLHRVLDRYIDSPARRTGIQLGEAIGRAAVERRDNDGSLEIRPFPSSTEPGRWAKTPTEYGGSNTTSTLPFLFSGSEVSRAPPPPALDSDVYRGSLEEARRLGGVDSNERTEAQTQAAIFWAAQSSQRGYVHLAIRLLDQLPQAGDPLDHARVMSQMTSAMADSAILSWREKERFAFWRPVTAIRAGSAGVTAAPDWLPILETPPFPEYPSGHAADCYTGSAFLQAAFGAHLRTITYVSQEGSEAALETLAVGMGQHGQISDMRGRFERRFASLDAAAHECAESRIWAGAHFRPGLDEARRLGRLIAARAAAAVPRIK